MRQAGTLDDPIVQIYGLVRRSDEHPMKDRALILRRRLA